MGKSKTVSEFLDEEVRGQIKSITEIEEMTKDIKNRPDYWGGTVAFIRRIQKHNGRIPDFPYSIRNEREGD